ncbi:MAG: hypothetical protein QXW72_04650 [Conexivisphaerales archaeon]
MELTRAYKFMIYPDANRQKEIELQLNLSKDFHNKLLGYAYKKRQNIYTKVHSMKRR